MCLWYEAIAVSILSITHSEIQMDCWWNAATENQGQYLLLTNNILLTDS